MTTVVLTTEVLEQLSAHVEAAYPEEGAGFLFGDLDGEQRIVRAILSLPNAREAEARHNRFLITPQDYVQAEQRAVQAGLEVLGVFHSHPDSPNIPSEFDRQWALPYFIYFITTVEQGKSKNHRVWILHPDRSGFDEITLQVVPSSPSPLRSTPLGQTASSIE